MPANTPEDLLDELQSDLAWRKVELSQLWRTLRTAKLDARLAMLRAYWLLSYAHWEGFIMKSSEKYIRYVARRRLKYSELYDGLALAEQSELIKNIKKLSGDISDKTAALSWISGFGDKRFALKTTEIQTRSNLNYDVLQDIKFITNVDLTSSVDKLYLDSILLARRNKIAHGEQLVIDISDAEDLKDYLLVWLDSSVTQFTNAAISKHYRAI